MSEFIRELLRAFDEWAVPVASVVATMVVIIVVVWIAVRLLVGMPPSCPNGYVLAGGGYGGAYHCIIGVAPVR